MEPLEELDTLLYSPRREIEGAILDEVQSMFEEPTMNEEIIPPPPINQEIIPPPNQEIIPPKIQFQGFDYNKFNRLMLFETLKHNENCASVLQQMSCDPNSMSNDDVNRLKIYVSNIENETIQTQWELGICKSSVGLFKAIYDIFFPEESQEFIPFFDSLQNQMVMENYSLSIIHNVFTTPQENMQFIPHRPFSRLAPQVIQALITILFNKIPKILKQVSDSYYTKLKTE